MLKEWISKTTKLYKDVNALLNFEDDSPYYEDEDFSLDWVPTRYALSI